MISQIHIDSIIRAIKLGNIKLSDLPKEIQIQINDYSKKQ